MKPNEREEKHSIDWLEESLRRLPTPEVPIGLKNRLIATIPVANNDVPSNRVVRSNLHYRRTLIAIAACIAVLLFSSFWLNRKQHLHSDDPILSFSMVSGLESSKITVEFHFEGETDPCNILEPQSY